jgi:hypothetical protein
MSTPDTRRRRWLRDNGLGLFFLVIFLLALGGQALAGHATFNAEQATSGLPGISMARYLTSASFGADVAENWQSEYLQFFLYIIITVWLVQRGSPESKPLDQTGQESDEQQRTGAHATADSPGPVRRGGLTARVYGWSLGLTMGGIFLLSWLAQSVAGVAAYDETRLRDLQAPLSWGQYVLNPDFWNRTLQNWQSEFLAVASMAILSIYLRQRGSPESKPVGAAHTATAEES